MDKEEHKMATYLKKKKKLTGIYKLMNQCVSASYLGKRQKLFSDHQVMELKYFSLKQ